LNLIIYVVFSPFQLISEPFFRMLCVSDSELPIFWVEPIVP